MKIYSLIGAAIIAAVGIYLWGQVDGRAGRSIDLIGEAIAAEGAAGSEWSPTEPSPELGVYYPGTEALNPDEMRVKTRVRRPPASANRSIAAFTDPGWAL